MTDDYPIRTISGDEYPAFRQIPGEAFLKVWEPEVAEIERGVIEFDRTIAAFDGAHIVGTASTYSFRLTVPGASAAAAGITLVSVLPGYRRRGILTAMMEHQIADAQPRGEALAILFASEPGIYGRYGFGLASWHQRFRIGRGDGRLAAGPVTAAAAGPRLRGPAPDQVRAELGQVYDRVLPDRPGMLARDVRWWDWLLADPPVLREGMSPLRCLLAEDASGPRGYALYSTASSWEDGIATGTLRVSELVAADPAATAALWSDLLTRDLVGEVRVSSRPLDDPLLAMLADPRRAHPALSDSVWVRLTDLPAALRQRRYSMPVDLVLEVIDPRLPANAGGWRLQSAGPGDTAPSCERSNDPADVLLTVQAAGAAYLGGASLSQQAAAGHASERTPGALTRLSAAMSWEPGPWTPQIF